MRQFYLYKNSSGYYNAVFVDPISGKKGTDKSTHTKDKIQATIIAQKWIESGAPQTRSNSRNFSATSTDNPLNLKDNIIISIKFINYLSISQCLVESKVTG